MNTATVDFNDDDIRDAVSQNAFAKAEAYVRQGRVIDVAMKSDGTIEAKVRGTEPKPYTQRIRLDPGGRGYIAIDGFCSCPVGYNCKHVAAALLAVLQGTYANQAADAPDLPDHAARLRALSPAVAHWLHTLDKVRHADGEDYPPEIRQRLFYLLRLAEQPFGTIRTLAVAPVSVRLRKDGTFSNKSSGFNPDSARAPFPAAFLRPSDRWILNRLASAPMADGRAGYAPRERTLDGEDGAGTLARILATGRARWKSVAGPVVAEGAAKPGRIVWRAQADGSQYPDLVVADGTTSFRLAPAWYADENTGVLGPLNLDCPPSLAQALLRAPAISPADASHVREQIAKHLLGSEAFLPAPFAPPELLRARPVPHLTLFSGMLPDSHSYWRSANKDVRAAPLARLSFCYGTVSIPWNTTEMRSVVHQEGRLYAVEREPSIERKAISRLHTFGLVQVSEVFPWQAAAHHHDFMLDSSDRSAWLDLLHRQVPVLENEGWSIKIAGDFPVRLAEFGSGLSAELRQGTGIDWFELDLGTMVDGKRVDLIPALISLIEADGEKPDRPDAAKTHYLALPDGRYLPVPAARLTPIVDALRELFHSGVLDEKNKRFGFPSLAAADLAALEEATAGTGLVWRGGEALREMGRKLRLSSGIPKTPLPASFKGTLRPYQAQGFDWLQFLLACGFGAVLADDMGLGKTVQALAHLMAEKEIGRADRPSLIVCPTSLVTNWRMEAERFAPELKTLTLHGPDRKARFGEIMHHDIVITTYPLLARDYDTLTAQPWHVVALDEAQTIKNPDALAAQFARRLEARQRLCLTGTPLENHLGELWSLFTFISPGFLGDKTSFNRRFRAPIEKQGNIERRALLARRVRPFLLRRTKEEVVRDLPPKSEIVEPIEFASPQRAIYEGIRLAMHARVREAIAAKGLARSQIIILDALLKLRQACCDPRLLKLETVKTAKASSAKLERLMEMIPALLDEGRKILLFSQFTSMLALIETALEKIGIDYALLTGDTKDRASPIHRFQSGAVPLFLISLKAGGTGLNLAAADTVILYDPWWNPAVEDQAASRAHRIGQLRPVFVHKLLAHGTIEEKMEALKTRKRELVRGILDESAGAGFSLSEAEIEDLLGTCVP